MPNRPPRLDSAYYRGLHRYFITGCTRHRAHAFADAPFACSAVSLLLQTAAPAQFEITAYCLMPDHAHVLLTALSDQAMCIAFWRAWRQRTGYAWSRLGRGRLWQDGFWDYVLRPHDDVRGFAAYVLHNPVRAGLVTSPDEYPWIGSSIYTVSELVDAVQVRPPRLRR